MTANHHFDVATVRYADLVDLQRLQELTDSFQRVTGVANAVLDVDGEVLTHSGWQHACTDFHRVHPDTRRRCLESDTALANRLLSGEPYTLYNCLNGLVDAAAPIVVDGRHIANVFIGQFFSAPPDLEWFRQRARQYGFDETAYLEAISQVPVLAPERVEALTRLYALLAQWLGDQALDHLRLRQASAELERFNRQLTQRVVEQTREISLQNEQLAREIAERELKEAGIQRLSHTYAALAKTNHVGMHARSEAELFDAVCRIAVEEGGIKMAWIGTHRENTDRIQPVASFGSGLEYLDGIVISVDAALPEGRGPTGTAYREGRAVLLQDFSNSPSTGPWQIRAGYFGDWHASAAFPIQRNGRPYAVLTLYHAETNAFDAQIVDLLASMVSDVGHALDVFDGETQRLAAEQALRTSEERFRSLAAVAPAGIFRCDAAGDCIYVNDKGLAITGLSAEEIMGAGWANALHPEDRSAVFAAWNQAVQERKLFEMEYRFQNRTGGVAWVIGRAVAEIDAKTGHVAGYVGTITDITAFKQAEEKLRLTARVFESTQEGIIVTDADCNMLEVNTALTRATGYGREEMLGQNPRILKSGRQGEEFYRAMWQAIEATGHWSGEMWNRKKDGEIYPQWITISAITDAQNKVTHYVGISSDITLLKQHEKQLERIAHYDALTGVPNRVLLVDRLRQALAQTRRSQKRLAVCYLDLDGFKPVNDTLGHDAGDRMLIEIAQRIGRALRGSDTVARLGGDEFVVLLLDLESAEECHITLERLLHTIAEPVVIQGRSFVVTASIGIALFPQDDVDPDTLLRHADQAMYMAKQSGKNRYHSYDPASDTRARIRHQAAARIEQGLQDQEFVLYYQPKVEILSQRMVGVEALIRWFHPERGLLSPAEFLPAIENSNLEIVLGEWVMDTALAQLAVWRRGGLDIAVSINIAASHLQSGDFVASLQRKLAAYPGLPPHSLEIEILETAALTDIPMVSKIIESCAELGVGFALDDFGTGYSSLTYLRNLPAQTLKIDQTFVRDMLADEGDRSIVQGVIALAKTFGRRLVAEGVEPPAHIDALSALGCEMAQGYGIARPMAAADLLKWYAQRG